MQPTLCSRCKKNVAVIFITRIENGESHNEGLCLRCARELHIKPVDEMMEKLGISDADLDNLTGDVAEMLGSMGMLGGDGAADTDPDAPDADTDEDDGKTATFPFLNRLFNQNPPPAADSDSAAASEPPRADGSASDKRGAAPRKLKFLNNYCIDLTQRARDGKLDAMVGRAEELEHVIQILNRRQKNNPCLIGEPGVGKTAIAEGLAQRIAEGNVPYKLRDKQVYLLDLTALVAGTQFRGQFESRMKGLIEEIRRVGNIILVIDEVHNIVGAGDAEGSMNAANILKPALSRGEIQVIGATTFAEYRKHIEKDAALERRFQPVTVAEPSIDDSVEILKGVRRYYEDFHGVVIPDAMCRLAVVLSERYITDRFLPDKAIDLIDEAGAYVEMKKTRSKVVDKQLVARVLARVANIDALAVQRDDTQVLASLMPHIKSLIYDQDEAVKSVVEAVQLSKAGLNDVHKPLASLLFVGPTGVGKTEVARVLAQELGVKLVRFDMSEYVEKHTVAKLIGSPAGYVGYDDGGLLTDAIRRSPDCVLLLDEIEKAHSDVFDILLQVMDYGVLTDNKGRKAYFHNVILIMTSNAGAQYASQASLGFASTTTAGSAMLKQVKHTFKPEFLNRLNGIIVFNDMDQHMASLVLDKKLRELKTLLKAKNVTLQLSKEAHDFLLKQGYSKEYGAREMDRAIERSLKTVLMREILFGSLKDGGRARVVVVGDELELKK